MRVPDSLIFGLLFLCGVGAYLAARATTPRQERQARAVLFLACACAIVFGTAALFGVGVRA